jgi:hypothetical protein
MIDIPDQVERLMNRLSDALPLPALGTQQLMATLRKGAETAANTPSCTVTRVDYGGDEGGILCHLAFKEGTGSSVVIASITHLVFDRRLQVAREIATYQKHRIKRLRRSYGVASTMLCT